MVPVALEVIDQRTISAVEASVYAAGLPTDAGAVLLIEIDGPAVVVTRELERARSLTSQAGASRVEVARDEQERQQFWRARKGAFGAMGRLAPDLYLYDTVVPRSKLPEVLERICEIGDRYRLRLSNVFHAGDGNLHPIISFDRRDSDEMSRVLAAGEEILRVCVEAGGVLSGEHGIGNEKQEFMRLLFDEHDLDAMNRLRVAFDPDGICNPGKVLPTPRSCVEAGLVTRDDAPVG
jgi:FAD/FMN-containing dehydrogenase